MAEAYAGHQFGHFVPQLGDGRANLLGEVIGLDGIRYDIQLKGSGRTPFSRGGDGRAALGPVLREYIVSEAMAALGVPTTRALAAVITGERVHARDTFARRRADKGCCEPPPRGNVRVFRGTSKTPKVCEFWRILRSPGIIPRRRRPKALSSTSSMA